MKKIIQKIGALGILPGVAIAPFIFPEKNSDLSFLGSAWERQ